MLYKAVVWVNTEDTEPRDESRLERLLDKATKHSGVVFTVVEITKVCEEDD